MESRQKLAKLTKIEIDNPTAHPQKGAHHNFGRCDFGFFVRGFQPPLGAMETELVMASDSEGASPLDFLCSFQPEFFVGAATYARAAITAGRCSERSARATGRR
jgi:hypothetical protein